MGKYLYSVWLGYRNRQSNIHWTCSTIEIVNGSDGSSMDLDLESQIAANEFWRYGLLHIICIDPEADKAISR